MRGSSQSLSVPTTLQASELDYRFSSNDSWLEKWPARNPSRKVLDVFGVSHPDDLRGSVTGGAGRMLGFLRDTLAPYVG